MAIKKVYFYEVVLFNEKGEEGKISYMDFMSSIQYIITKKAKVITGYRTLNLIQDGDEYHTIMDIKDFKYDFLFSRVSKQKQNNFVLKRDYKTLKDTEVIPAIEVGQSGIEAYTYLYYNYKSGILGIVSSNGAPNESIFTKLFDKFNKKIRVRLKSIPNKNAVNRIFKDRKPVISKFEVEMAVPSAKILKEIFNWEDDEIIDLVAKRGASAKIVISSKSRSGLNQGIDEAKGLVKQIKDTIDDYDHAKVYAKTEIKKMKDYDLFGEYFSYNIDIPTHKTVAKKKQEFSVEELTAIYRENLLMAYNDNANALKLLIKKNKI